MSSQVDLSQLAIERGDAVAGVLRPKRQILTRYVFPSVLVVGFLGLLAWASWDFVIPPRSVTVVPVLAKQSALQRAGTPLFKAAGWIEPRPTPIRVAALAPGVVESLLVVEDQPVTAGEAVAEMVKEDSHLAYQGAQADFQLRRAELAQAQAAQRAAQTRFDQPVHLSAVLDGAEAALAKIGTKLRKLPFDIEQAKAMADFALTDFEAKQSIPGAVSGRTIDEARSHLLAANAKYRGLIDRQAALEKEQAALRSRRDAVKTQLTLLADEMQKRDETTAQVGAAAARLEQARVAVAEAKLRLDRMTVRAPIDGRVFRLITEPGARVGEGMTQMEGHDGSTIVTLYRPESLQVRVDVRFEDIPNIRLGQPVEIENPALPETILGRVLFASSEADIQKNTLEVKVAIDSTSQILKPQMLVDVTFLAPEQAEATDDLSEPLRLYLPQRLIQQDEAGSFVWVADQSARRARRTLIETGITGVGGLVEIASGLTPSSRIIIGGEEDLRDGERIRVTAEQADFGFAASGPQTTTSRGSMSRLPQGGSL